MEEKEHHCDLYARVGESVGVSIAVAFEQCVGAQLAQVVAQLVQSVAFVVQAEARQDNLVELLGTLAASRRPWSRHAAALA